MPRPCSPTRSITSTPTSTTSSAARRWRRCSAACRWWWCWKSRSIAGAIAALGDVDHVPLLDAGLIDDRQRYIVALHVSLDLDALPVPMRVMGYFSSDWRLSSEWYTWPLR